MTTSKYSAIALDLGTTSIKAGLLDSDGELRDVIAHPAPRIIVSGGHYESDALAYAETAEQALRTCVAHAGDCKSLGICTQRSSFLVWEQATGRPLTPLISWQDTRGAASCKDVRAHEDTIRKIAGLPLTPYYFAPKLRVVLQDNPEWPARLERGELRAGTLDTFLIWRWSGGRNFVTDASMAARTLLMDVHQQKWSARLCDLFGIPPGILPDIKPSAGMNIGLDNGLMLQASVGDQSAARIAGVSEDQPEALVNLGTGCFVARYLPDARTLPEGYLHTLVHMDRQRHVHFAVEGTINSVAAALAPYPVGDCRMEDLAMDGLAKRYESSGTGMPSSRLLPQSAGFASNVSETDDIFCVAEPSGLGAPYFRGDIGVRFSQPVEQFPQRRIAALLLEAVIFRVARILEDLHRECPIERVYLSGGLSELICLQQGIALCVPFEVYHLRQSESSLQGAALLAAGMAPASHRTSERISVAAGSLALRQKYQRWKIWLDDLLAI
ncbi:MAG: FGGY family carbohydrate kinase [Gallionella sp.]